MMHHRPPLLLAALSLFLIGPAQADEPAQLETIRFEFQIKLAELIKPLEELDRKYAEHLEKQKQSLQTAGKLKVMLAVDEELKWLIDKPIEENPSQGQPLSSIPELKRLQEIYRKQWTVLENKYASPDKKLALIQTYRKQTGDLAEAWTKAGKIDDAKLALAESERFAAMERDVELAAKAGRTVASGPAMRTGDDFAGKKAGEEMKNGSKMKFCWVPPGKFTMGSPENEIGREASKEAQVEVELTYGFWMGKYEVTQAEYEKVIGTNPAKFKIVGENAPVEQVSWDDAMAFCEKLNERERRKRKLPEGWAYTLPTEVQWEYACRAGEKGPYSGGKMDEVGWYGDNSGSKAHGVGEKKPNILGLHDMHGNLREWCLDWYSDTLPGGKNPTGPTSGSFRVNRGGGWYRGALGARAASRFKFTQTTRTFDLGFRVCLISTSK